MTFDGKMADRLTAVVLCLLGLAMAWGGFDMDRLEARRIHPSSIPGLVPIILGICMMVCAFFLGLGNTLNAEKNDQKKVKMDLGNWSDLAFATGWSCIFAILLVSRIPFMAASALYIAVFAAWYLWPQQVETTKRIKMLVLVALYAGLVAAGISAIFQYGFLVRLP